MKRWRRKARLRKERERERIRAAKEREEEEALAVLNGLSGIKSSSYSAVPPYVNRCQRCSKPLPVGRYCSFACLLNSYRCSGILYWGVEHLKPYPAKRSRVPLRFIRKQLQRKRNRAWLAWGQQKMAQDRRRRKKRHPGCY